MKTADPELMRAINRFHVMDAIRRHGPVSRVQICQVTELSATTVSAITAALLDDRLITSLQVGAVRDAGRGRPRVMLQLNPDAAYVVGVRLAPDQITVAVTNFCADILHSLSLPIRIDRQTAAVIADLVEDGVRRCIEDAGLEMLRHSRRLRRAAGSRRAVGGRMPAKPDLRRPRRAVWRGADAAARRPRVDRQRRQPCGACRALVRPGARPQRFSGRQRRAQPRARHPAQWRTFSRRKRPLARTSATSWSARPGNGGGRLGDMASEISVLGESDAALASGRGMAVLLRRADEGDKACLAALAAAGEALGCAVANLITLFAPPKVIITGSRDGEQRAFHPPLARDGRGAPPAEPRRRLRPRRARMGRQHLGARRGGHDFARTLWRALGHDRPRAASRVG